MKPRLVHEKLDRSARIVFCRLLTAFCLLLAFHSIPPVAFASTGAWTRQRASSLAWLHALFFLDQNRGWAAGSRGTLLFTADGGATWQAKPLPTSDSIRDIYFSDQFSGFLVCERNIFDLKSNVEARAYLMKTSDGGEHWTRVNLRSADADVRLVRAIFNKAGRGWVFGEGGAIFTTEDDGANWVRLQAPTRYLLLGGAFSSENSGWLVGAGSTILQTANGGRTWSHARLPSTTSVRLNSTSFADARLGWAVGNGGAIFRTSNAGRSWQAQKSGVTADLLDVKFLDSIEGWAVGTEGTVLHTMSGGLRWTVERSGTPHTLERVFFSDRNHGWAVGFGGTIISYGAAEAPKLRR